jgi:hypothetical protein
VQFQSGGQLGRVLERDHAVEVVVEVFAQFGDPVAQHVQLRLYSLRFGQKAPIPRLLTRYLRAGPRKVAVLGGRAIGLDDLGKQYLSSPLDSPVLPNVMMQSPPALGRLVSNRGLLEVFVVPLGLGGLVQVC